ncbi:hypothetical protein GE061_006378 [Apolygus lucorum]|uniref:Protein takeout n=1 Tax=Apolygus lucorum TaxID=248454 RepID=A0A8S9WTT0_APOLU|nr:hypothetical protein GE061_006378 [Apolygus lucorum]
MNDPSSHWTACKRGPKHNECLRNSIQKTVPDLVKGLPNVGIMAIDPLRFSKIQIEQGTGPVSINLTLVDLEIKGLKNMIINEVKNDWKNMMLRITAPQLNLIGQYKIDGKVLILPVHGNGDSMFDLGNLTANAVFRLSEKMIAGKRHYQVKAVDVKLATQSLHLHFDNLFDGNKQLGDHFNEFINENWKEVFEELKPALEKAVKHACESTAGQFFTKVPKNEITPP